MSAPLSRELRTKYSVSLHSPLDRQSIEWLIDVVLIAKIVLRALQDPVLLACGFSIDTQKCQLLPLVRAITYVLSQYCGDLQVNAVPVRKDDEVSVVRGTYKVCATGLSCICSTDAKPLIIDPSVQ